MAQHPHDSICAISIRSQDDDDEGTGSGILINSQQGLILTHATLLQPFLSEDSKILKHLHSTGFVKGEDLRHISGADIIFPSNLFHLNGSEKLLKQRSPSALNSNLQVNSCFYDKFSGSVMCIFKCYSLQKVVHKLLSSDNWKFIDNISEDLKKNSKQKEESLYVLLPCFVLLKLQNWTPLETSLSAKDSASIVQGDMVEICATPFGTLNPDIFLNSRSRGIVSNMVGERNVLILTDARCIPGSEGGALFSCDIKQRYLVGIIIASLCWRTNEWIGLTLAASITEVLESLKGHYSKSASYNSLTNMQPYYGALNNELRLLPIINHVPLVSVGNTWGSGVILNAGPGLVLTCSHVLKGSNVEKVKLYLHCSQTPVDVDIVHQVPLSSHFDLGLLSMATEQSPEQRDKIAVLEVPDISEGDFVYVVGHAIFGKRYNMPPTVTAGNVSKVVTVNRVPVMIQTTCAVHAGASGGGVFDQKGRLVAVVVNNTKDTTSNASYPHINMCIPMKTIAPVINEYIETQDVYVLNKLVIKNKLVKRLWSLSQEASSATLSSKL
ncbi:hypothetical protein CHS0354_008212 [Potamilus streckersoni]|uniref:Peroxisomal leader peptide-processing protease n=1 Tax=Potamilus streckersoni TaxID=2493646 RepID=A0AAE0VL83_9BIVA|nr:hypothetical protein CHS0354_008212 [Potamilus streckersoni]